MHNREPIILITGPKHSGKSLCARALGKITGWKVVDLDELMEKQTGKSPRMLYREGPEIFRKAEAFALTSLILPLGASAQEETEFLPDKKFSVQPERGGLVVAAGGGLIDNPEAIALLTKMKIPPEAPLPLRRRKLIIVFLDVSQETAWQRILNTAAGGELPVFLDDENPKENHSVLHIRRSEAYKALAHLSVSAENKSPESLAGEIADDLGLPVEPIAKPVSYA
jgi:shikimate kinase